MFQLRVSRSVSRTMIESHRHISGIGGMENATLRVALMTPMSNVALERSFVSNGTEKIHDVTSQTFSLPNFSKNCSWHARRSCALHGTFDWTKRLLLWLRLASLRIRKFIRNIQHFYWEARPNHIWVSLQALTYTELGDGALYELVITLLWRSEPWEHTPTQRNLTIQVGIPDSMGKWGIIVFTLRSGLILYVYKELILTHSVKLLAMTPRQKYNLLHAYI